MFPDLQLSIEIERLYDRCEAICDWFLEKFQRETTLEGYYNLKPSLIGGQCGSQPYISGEFTVTKFGFDIKEEFSVHSQQDLRVLKFKLKRLFMTVTLNQRTEPFDFDWWFAWYVWAA